MTFTKYLLYIKEEIEKLLGKEITICEDNAQSENSLNDVVIVFTSLGGSTDSNDVQVVPFNLIVWTNENNNINETLSTFVVNNNGKSITIDTTNYKQYLNLPLQQEAHNQDAGGFKNTCIVSGFLSIVENCVDIKKVYINGNDNKFIDAKLSYATSVTSAKLSGERHLRSSVLNSNIVLTLTCNSRVGMLNNIMHELRNEGRNPNTAIDVVVVFTDDTQEKYKMYIMDSSLSTDKMTPAKVVYNLGVVKE